MPASQLHRLRGLYEVLRQARLSSYSLVSLAALTVVHSLLSLVPPRITSDIIDRVLPAGRQDGLHSSILLLAAVLLGLLLLRGTRSYLGVNLGLRIERSLRSRLCCCILGARPSALAGWSDGELATSLTHDIEQIRDQSIMLIQSGVANIVLSFGALILLARESPQTAVAGALLAAVSIIGSLRAGVTVRRRVDAARTARSELLDTVQEVLRGVRTIHTHGAYGFAESAVEGRSRQHTRAMSAAELTQEAVAIGLSLPALLLAIIVWYVCSTLVIAKEISLGTLVMCVAYLGMILAPLNATVSLIGPIARCLSAADRYLRLVGAPGLPISDTGGVSAAPRGLSLTNVSLLYSGHAVLREVSLRLPECGLVHFSGPSGSGKTSLVRLLCGLVEPTHGAVMLDGCDLRSLTRERISRAVVVASQDELIFACSLADNVSLARATGSELGEALAMTGLTGLLDRLPGGQDTQIGKGGVTLSSGQCNRIALSRAMLRRPRVLILDEVLANLDSDSRRSIVEELIACSPEQLIIVVSHDAMSDVPFTARLRVEGGGVTSIAQEQCRLPLAS